MSQNKYKTPQIGGAAEIRKAYEESRKRKPSKELLEILRQKPKKKSEAEDKKIAHPFKEDDVEI